MSLPQIRRSGRDRSWTKVARLAIVFAAAMGFTARAAEDDPRGRARCNLLIWVAPEPKAATPLVFLDRPQDAKVAGTPDRPIDPGLLLRELARQAVLMAARDGCDARTRDAVLGDVAEDDKPTATLSLEWEFRADGRGAVVLRREGGDILWALPSKPNGDARDLAELAEALQAQATGPLVEAFVKVGLKRANRAPAGVVEIPTEVERALDRMNAVSQWAAVRGLHARARTRGNALVLLAALARGYATLGVMTEHHWHPAHKVYKARALLYGRCAAASDAKSPIGLWSLAFAEALAGRPRDALGHLAEADRRGGSAIKPGWVEQIRSFAGENREALVAGDAANDPLARLLGFLLAEGGSGIDNNYSDVASAQILRAASELLLLEPNCFRAHDAVCRFSGVSLLHQATTLAPQLFEKSIEADLHAVPGVPEALGDNPPKALEAVRGADRGEPGLAALASLVREERFVQAWRRLDFLAFKLSVPRGEGPMEELPLVADHPLRPFLDGHWRGFNRREFLALARRLLNSDIELTAAPLIHRVRAVDPETAGLLLNRALSHGDSLARDFADAIREGPTAMGLDLARQLLEIRPKSPIARSTIVAAEKNLDPKLAADWENDPTAGPGLLGALGRRYQAARRWPDAERCLAKSIEGSPDRWAYTALANVYKAQGKTDKWLATLEEVLKQEDNALDHAQVRDDIARELMNQKKYQEALPYADAAASSGAAWAMLTASLCHEKLGDWEEAEQLIRSVSERYDSSTTQWFWWCKRTERGDLMAALALAKPRFAAIANTALANTKTDATYAYNYGTVLILANESRLALEFTQKSNAREYNASLAIRVAILADALGEVQLRDRTLTQLVGDTQTVGPATKKILILIREWLARPDADKAGPDLVKIDAVLDALPKGRGDVAYTAAQFLDNHGRKDEAVAYMAIAGGKAPPVETDERIRVLARWALRDRGLDPDKVTPRPRSGN